jgi:hypothetical protein
MALEVTAKLMKIFPEKTGDGKNGKWIKQDFIVETQESYPKKILFNAWGEKAEGIKNLSVGDTLKVSFNIEAREFNEKWYNDLRVWKIEKVVYKDATASGSTEEGGNADELDEPFVAKNEADDLPF